MAYLPPPDAVVPTAGMVAPGAPPYPTAAGMPPVPPGAVLVGPHPAAPYTLSYPGGVPGTPYHAPPTAIGFQPLFPAYQSTGGPPLNSLQPMAVHGAPPAMNNNGWNYAADPTKAINPYQMNPVITQQPQPGWTQNSRYHKYDSDSDSDYMVDSNGQRVKNMNKKKKNKGCCGGGGGCCDPTTLCCVFCIWLNCCPKDYSCLGCFDCGDCFDCFDCNGCGDCTDCGDCDGCDHEMD